MYIKQIQLQNFQAIKEFSGNFEGNVYLVTGENELGKSTLLKAIMTLLTGNRDEVLRNGEEKGFAKIVVGGDGKEYEVELRMTKANPRGTITIKQKETGLKSDRITALQEIFGYQDFDANEFVSWSETAEGRRKQVQIVKSLLPSEIQSKIMAIDSEVLLVKEERKTANTELKTYTTIFNNAAKQITVADIEKYAEPLDLEELLKKQQENAEIENNVRTAREKLLERERTLEAIPTRLHNEDKALEDFLEYSEQRKLDAKSALDEAIAKAKKEYEQTLQDIQEKIAEAQQNTLARKEAIMAEKADAEERRNNCLEYIKMYEENKPENISKQIADVQTHNEKHNKVKEYKAAESNKNEAANKLAEYEQKLNDLLTEREQLVKTSKLPIPGLNFTEDGLELNGIPFVAGKVSDSQIMEVAAKLIIAKNPTVKVFRIARGESLGKKKLEALVSFAKENGYQGFIENVVREQNELRVEQYNEI